MSRLRVAAIALLATAALALASGCEAASAQGALDAGVRARVRTDAGVRARVRADGGVRARARADGGVPVRARADGGIAREPRDAGPRRARRDGGPRRWRRDAGVDASTGAGTDAGTLAATPSTPEPAPDGGGAAIVDVLDAGATAALEAGLAIPGELTDGGAALVDDAGALVIPDAGMLDDGGPSDAGADAAIVDAGVLHATAGPVDAGPPHAAATPSAPTFDPWELLARIADGRDDEQEEDADPESGGAAPPVVIPLAGDDEVWERLEALVPALPSGRGSSFALLLLLVAAIAGARWIGRARRHLPDRGALPRALAIGHALLRLSVALLVVGLLAELLPDWARSALPWVVVAAAVALGWSARDLLRDLVAGAVLLTERRIARGEHVRIGEHEGVVTLVGLRVTTLRDATGRELRVPNRVVLSSPTTSQRTARHEVVVRVRAPDGVAPEAFTRALRDAVLLSAWTPVPARVDVARDPGEPRLFEVRATLVDARFEPRFRGELLTRAEAVLAADEE